MHIGRFVGFMERAIEKHGKLRPKAVMEEVSIITMKELKSKKENIYYRNKATVFSDILQRAEK
jgi:hypothetical protein